MNSVIDIKTDSGNRLSIFTDKIITLEEITETRTLIVLLGNVRYTVPLSKAEVIKLVFPEKQ